MKRTERFGIHVVSRQATCGIAILPHRHALFVSREEGRSTTKLHSAGGGAPAQKNSNKKAKTPPEAQPAPTIENAFAVNDLIHAKTPVLLGNIVAAERLILRRLSICRTA
jgi:hypothetical protein